MNKRHISILGATIAVVIIGAFFAVDKAFNLEKVVPQTTDDSNSKVDLIQDSFDTKDQTIGELPSTLTYDRLVEADDEWNSHPKGPVAEEGFKWFAEKEFPNPPKTVTDLLASMAGMYRGEEPFTHSRAIALEYYSMQEPFVSELALIGPFPTPMIDDSSNQDVRIHSINESYKEFKQYVDKVDEIKTESVDELRNYQLDTSKIEIVGVEVELLEAVMKEISESDEKNLEKLIHPEAVTGALSFFNMTRKNKSVTKLELDNSRVDAIKEEFGLEKEKVQMVKVHMLQLDGTPTDLNLIYVYSNDEWLLFRID